jgi:molecular chaperone DnaJ
MEAALGTTTRVVIPRLETCGACSGSGAASEEGVRTCRTCGGHGQLRFQQGFFSVSRTCTACGGQGREVVDPCGDCRGQGRVRRQEQIEIHVPPGVETGARLRLTGQGEAGARGGPEGDLYVFLRVKEHEYFERDGLDLHCRFPISFAQAALGTSVKVPGLESEEELTVPAGTQSGHVIRLRGRGLAGPDGRGRGDQFVHLQVVVPRRLSAKQRRLIQELAGTDSGTPDIRDENFFQKVKKLFS